MMPLLAARMSRTRRILAVIANLLDGSGFGLTRWSGDDPAAV